MAGNKNSGGARQGTGPVVRRFTLSPPAALFLRELTRNYHKRKDVTRDEVNAMLDRIVREYAERDKPPHDVEQELKQNATQDNGTTQETEPADKRTGL